MHRVGSSVPFTWFCRDDEEGQACLGVEWLLSGTPLEQLPHISAHQSFNSASRTGLLTLDNLTLDLNGSRVEARGRYPAGVGSTHYVGVLLVEGQHT